jgi:hypothetical protein
MRDLNQSVGRYRVRDGHMPSNPEDGNMGMFFVPLKTKTIAVVIATDGMIDEHTHSGWEHVSVHIRYRNDRGKTILRTPTWDEMCQIKGLFFEAEETVVQYHPPESQYVNTHPHVLHLWRPTATQLPTPPKHFV